MIPADVKLVDNSELAQSFILSAEYKTISKFSSQTIHHPSLITCTLR